MEIHRLKKIVVWLCSSRDDELRELIRKFSLDLDSVAFLPHITLLGTVEMENSLNYQHSVQNIAQNWSPLELTLDGIDFEDNFWRCFYYKAFPKKVLSQLHLELANGLSTFGARVSDNFMPHLSLAYAKMNIAQQQDFLVQYQNILFPRTLTFDTVKIVHFIPDNVNDWEVLDNISLTKRDK